MRLLKIISTVSALYCIEECFSINAFWIFCGRLPLMNMMYTARIWNEPWFSKNVWYIKEPLNKAELASQKFETIELHQDENPFNQSFLKLLKVLSHFSSASGSDGVHPKGSPARFALVYPLRLKSVAERKAQFFELLSGYFGVAEDFFGGLARFQHFKRHFNLRLLFAPLLTPLLTPLFAPLFAFFKPVFGPFVLSFNDHSFHLHKIRNFRKFAPSGLLRQQYIANENRECTPQIAQSRRVAGHRGGNGRKESFQGARCFTSSSFTISGSTNSVRRSRTISLFEKSSLYPLS